MLAIFCEENNHGHNLSNYRVFVVLCEENVIFCQPYNYKNIDMKDKTKFIENKYRVFVKNYVKTYRYFLGTLHELKGRRRLFKGSTVLLYQKNNIFYFISKEQYILFYWMIPLSSISVVEVFN